MAAILNRCILLAYEKLPLWDFSGRNPKPSCSMENITEGCRLPGTHRAELPEGSARTWRPGLLGTPLYSGVHSVLGGRPGRNLKF